ncbi:hypothetical protein Tco_0232375 [Tanacetum coccineum]
MENFLAKKVKEDSMCIPSGRFSTLTKGGKMEAGSSPLHLVKGSAVEKINDGSGDPRSSLDGKFWAHRRMTKDNQCASRVEDSSNTKPMAKKEARSSPSSSEWDPVLVWMEKLLGPRRMKKKINVHPEWKILQTLTNGVKRKLDHLLLHLVNGLLWKTNDESGTPRSQSGWKTSWAKKDAKRRSMASRLVGRFSKPNQCSGEAGSSPSSSGKWVCGKLMMRVGPLVLVWMVNFWARRMDKEDHMCFPEWKDSSNTNQWGKKKQASSPLNLGNGLLWNYV